jgi:hypothetical protein
VGLGLLFRQGSLSGGSRIICESGSSWRGGLLAKVLGAQYDLEGLWVQFTRLWFLIKN